jgi:hypothetical protein
MTGLNDITPDELREMLRDHALIIRPGESPRPLTAAGVLMPAG